MRRSGAKPRLPPRSGAIKITGGEAGRRENRAARLSVAERGQSRERHRAERTASERVRRTMAGRNYRIICLCSYGIARTGDQRRRGASAVAPSVNVRRLKKISYPGLNSSISLN